MELARHEPGVAGQLHHFHQPPVGGQPGQGQPRLCQRLPVVVVELIAVAVALVDLICAVDGRGQRTLRQPAGIAAQPHGAPLGGHPHLAGHQVNDGIGGGGVQLGGVGPRQSAHVPGVLHHRQLHPQADAQERNFVLPGVPDGLNLALNPPAAEAAGHQDALDIPQQFVRRLRRDLLRVHPAHVHRHLVFDPAVGEGLRHRQVGVVEPHVLAHQGDGDAPRRVLGPVDHGGPLGEVGRVADQPQPPHHHVGQPLPLQHQRHLVEEVRRQVGDGVVRRDIAEQGYLVQNVLGDGGVAAAHDDVRLDAQAEQLLGGVLGGLGLQLPGAGDGHDEGHVDEHHVVPPPLGGHLPDGLQEGLGFDIAHGAADLHNGRVRVRPLQGVDVPLDLVGDVGDDLHRPPQIVPRPLPVEHVPVDLPGGHGGVEGQVLVYKPLVVAQVQVGLRPVVGDEHLPVLVGGHGARVHIQVGVQLLHPYPKTPLLQQPAQGRRRDPFAQPGHHAAGDKDEFRACCHMNSSPGRRGPLAPGALALPCPISI